MDSDKSSGFHVPKCLKRLNILHLDGSWPRSELPWRVLLSG